MRRHLAPTGCRELPRCNAVELRHNPASTVRAFQSRYSRIGRAARGVCRLEGERPQPRQVPPGGKRCLWGAGGMRAFFRCLYLSSSFALMSVGAASGSQPASASLATPGSRTIPLVRTARSTAKNAHELVRIPPARHGALEQLMSTRLDFVHVPQLMCVSVRVTANSHLREPAELTMIEAAGECGRWT